MSYIPILRKGNGEVPFRASHDSWSTLVLSTKLIKIWTHAQAMLKIFAWGGKSYKVLAWPAQNSLETLLNINWNPIVTSEKNPRAPIIFTSRKLIPNCSLGISWLVRWNNHSWCVGFKGMQPFNVALLGMRLWTDAWEQIRGHERRQSTSNMTRRVRWIPCRPNRFACLNMKFFSLPSNQRNPSKLKDDSSIKRMKQPKLLQHN